MMKDHVRNALYYMQLIWDKRIYFMIPAALVLLVGLVVVYSIPKSYSSEALLIVEGQQISSSLVPSTVTNERLQLIEQRLLARDNLIQLAQRHNLFPQLWGELSNAKIADVIRKNITVTTETPEGSDQSTASSIVRLGFKYSEPKQAADVTADLVDMLMNETKRLRVSRATEATQFLTREANALAEQLQAKEAYRDKFVEENKDSMPSRLPQLSTDLLEKERARTAVDDSIAVTTQDVSLLEAQLRLGVMNTNDASRRRAQLVELQSEIDQKRLIYSEDHPKIRALRQQMEQLQAALAKDTVERSGSGALDLTDTANLPPDLALIAQRIAIAKDRLASLDRQKEEAAARVVALKAMMARVPDVETQLNAMEVERVSLQRSIDDMNGKLDTARIGERLENDQSAMQMQIIEKPEIPQYPASPRRIVFLMLVLVLSVGAGVAGAVVADMFTSHIRGTFDLANALKGQTLVVIPEWSINDEIEMFTPGWVGSILRKLRARTFFPRHPIAQNTSQL